MQSVIRSRFILRPRIEINVRQAKLSQAKVRQSGHFEQETKSLVAPPIPGTIKKVPCKVINFIRCSTPSCLNCIWVFERCEDEADRRTYASQSHFSCTLDEDTYKDPIFLVLGQAGVNGFRWFAVRYPEFGLAKYHRGGKDVDMMGRCD